MARRVSVLLVLALLLACQAPAAEPARPRGTRAEALPATTIPAVPTAAPAASAIAPLQPPVTVKAALLMTFSDVGVYIAEERGYFAAEGLEIEATRVDGAAQAMPHLATGQLDVAGITAAASFFNAINRGLPLRIAGDKGRQTPEYSNGALVLRPDIADSGRVRDFPDLRGLNLGINVPNTGTVTDIQLDRLLERGGLTRDDIGIVALPYPDMNAAFASRTIDVGYQVEPFVTLGEDQGLLRRWRSLGEITPDQYTTVWVYSPSFAESEAGYRFMAAYLRGVRDFTDAFVYGRGKPAVVDILVERTAVRDRALYDKMRFNVLDPDGRIMPERIAADVDYYLAHGYMQQPIDVATVIDSRFTDYAVGRLGPYRPPTP